MHHAVAVAIFVGPAIMSQGSAVSGKGEEGNAIQFVEVLLFARLGWPATNVESLV